jgi:3-hydroxybutyryl-CoA dehydrogenase
MEKLFGIIGAGTMGSGIASVAALKGFKTIIYDTNSKMLDKGKSSIVTGYDKLISKSGIDESSKDKALSNLLYSGDFNSLSQCNFIIEAATESLEVKKEIFSRLGIITDPATVLASNTSSLSVTSISSAVQNDKTRVVGMHFFNPANVMKLVEIVKGEFTSENTLNEAVGTCKLLGKTPVVCKDTPAFIVNRVARPFYLEALRILGEGGLDAGTIDKIVKDEGGFKMGPFELMDLIGIDINYSVTKSVYEALSFNPKYKPHPIQQKMVEEGLLGRKTGKGFYKY